MSFYGNAVRILRPIIRCFYRVTVIGSENEPDTPFVLCTNHSSFIDPIICCCFIKKPLRFIARSSLSRFRPINWLFKKANVIPISRDYTDLTAMRTVIGAAKNGDCIGIFPQGTRMRRVEPQPEQAMPGIALIGSQTNAPMLPVSIITKRRMPGFFRKTYLIIGKPVPPEEYLGNGVKTKKETAAFIFSKVCEPFAIPFEELKNHDKDR